MRSPTNQNGMAKWLCHFSGCSIAACAVLVAALLSPVGAGASSYTLGARDTSVQLDLAGGLSQWTVDGVNQLNLQTFYYSVGSGPATSIYTIGLPSAPTITTNFSKTTVTLNTTYADPIISVGTQFQIQSSPVGSGKATLAQTFTINNPSSTAQVYHFYQYSDFDLGGVSGGQNVQFSSNGSGQQYQVVQTDSTGRTLTGLVTGVSRRDFMPSRKCRRDCSMEVSLVWAAGIL